MANTTKQLKEENQELLRQLNQIKNSKFYKLWQSYCNLRNKVFKNKHNNTYDYYHKNTFWNDHPLVIEYINKLISGNPKIDWMHYLYNNYFSNKKNSKLLSVICGNGWQDKEIDTIFNFQNIDGYDISQSLLNEAKKLNSSNKFNYYHSDLNKDFIKCKNYYDLAINLAGLHHIENMDHAVSQVHNSLKKGGIFAHFEYIGPKRNQYSDNDLKYMNKMQHNFPSILVGREPIVRPNIEVMLREDPSEAVGSENIIPTLKKYFKIIELKYFNGGMLYQVLYNQIQHFDVNNLQHNQLLQKNLELEEKMTQSKKVKPLFAFIVCQK